MVNGSQGLIVSWVIITDVITNLMSSTSFVETTDNEELRLKCYTCVNVSDNIMCNRFAVEIPCPEGKNFCHTLHIMDSKGFSVVVNKKCADSSECWPQGVGCLKIDTQTVCVSCCDETYCNVTVPTNQSDTVFFTKRTNRHRNETTTTSNSSNRIFFTLIHQNQLQFIIICYCVLFLIYK